MSYDLLAEIALDTGTELLSIHGTRTSSGFYDGRLTDISDLVREIEPGGGTSPVQSGSFGIRDADGKWKKKLASTTFKKRALTLKLANRSTGVADTVFVGIVQNASSETETVEIDFRDPSFDRLEEALTLKVFPDIFSDMPETTPVELIPIVLGTVASTSFDSAGHIPAYLVDPAETLSVYRYVASQVALKSISAVYRNGELVDSGDYTVSYANITTPEHGAVRMTFIDFDREQRTRGGDRDALITYDATGLTDDGLETGTLITDPAEALQALLELRGVVLTAEFDSTLIGAATTAYAAAGITAGVALVDKGDSYLDVIDEFANSYNLQFFRTRAGKYGMRFDNAAAGTSSIEYFDDQTIQGDSFEVSHPEDSAATWEFLYAFDAARNNPTARNSFNDSTEQTALGRDVRVESDTPYLRDINQALKIHEIKSFQARSSRHLTEVVVPPEPTLELGEYVKLTHFAGPSSDGLGYRSKVFQVVGLNLTYDDGLYHELSLIDAPGLSLSSPAESEDARSTQSLPPPSSEIFSDIVWDPTDQDTVEWSEHDIKLVGAGDFIEYTTVASGTTGNMATDTPLYVYFDPEANTAALQTTTDFKVATTPGRWLMAVCLKAPSSGELALIDNRVGFVTVNSQDVVRQVGGDQLPDDTIRTRHLVANLVTANEIAAGTITTTELNATAIDGMTITGSIIRTASSGARVQLDSTNGFQAFDADGDIRIRISGNYDAITLFDANGTSISVIGGLGSDTAAWNPTTTGVGSLFLGSVGEEWEDIGAICRDDLTLKVDDGTNNAWVQLVSTVGPDIRFYLDDSEVLCLSGADVLPGGDDNQNLGSSSRAWSNIWGHRHWVKDGIGTPSTISGWASIYVDSGDGDLKVKFGDGTVKTIVTDT